MKALSSLVINSDGCFIFNFLRAIDTSSVVFFSVCVVIHFPAHETTAHPFYPAFYRPSLPGVEVLVLPSWFWSLFRDPPLRLYTIFLIQGIWGLIFYGRVILLLLVYVINATYVPSVPCLRLSLLATLSIIWWDVRGLLSVKASCIVGRSTTFIRLSLNCLWPWYD